MALLNFAYIDIHTHSFSEQNDVYSIKSIHPDGELFLSESFDYSVGLHPWRIASSEIESSIPNIEKISKKSNVVAIGETGLDRLTETPLAVQERIFERQIDIAEKHSKPIIIHCVKCFSELMAIRKKSSSSIPWIIHGYQKNKQIAESLLELGCYLSFGDALLKNEKLQELFTSLPSDRLFLETDESDVDICKIYSKAAELKKIDLNVLQQKIHTNFKTCFNKL